VKILIFNKIYIKEDFLLSCLNQVINILRKKMISITNINNKKPIEHFLPFIKFSVFIQFTKSILHFHYQAILKRCFVRETSKGLSGQNFITTTNVSKMGCLIQFDTISSDTVIQSPHVPIWSCPGLLCNFGKNINNCVIVFLQRLDVIPPQHIHHVITLMESP